MGHLHIYSFIFLYTSHILDVLTFIAYFNVKEHVFSSLNLRWDSMRYDKAWAWDPLAVDPNISMGLDHQWYGD